MIRLQHYAPLIFTALILYSGCSSEEATKILNIAGTGDDALFFSDYMDKMKPLECKDRHDNLYTLELRKMGDTTRYDQNGTPWNAKDCGASICVVSHDLNISMDKTACAFK